MRQLQKAVESYKKIFSKLERDIKKADKKIETEINKEVKRRYKIETGSIVTLYGRKFYFRRIELINHFTFAIMSVIKESGEVLDKEYQYSLRELGMIGLEEELKSIGIY